MRDKGLLNLLLRRAFMCCGALFGIAAEWGAFKAAGAEAADCGLAAIEDRVKSGGMN